MKKNRFVRRTVPFLLLSSFMLLAGCATSPNFLAPASSIAAREASLFWILIGLSAVVFIVVEGLLIYNVIRFRKRASQKETPPQVYREHLIEVIYTAIPVLIVIAIFILMMNTMQAVAAPAPKNGDLTVRIVGHRWWWEFDYPDLKVKTANELHIPLNTTVQVDLESLDVIHSFYVPQLSGKTDVIPGQTNHMWLRADKVGVFYGQCSEFCGANHANMRIRVFVDTQADFNAWVAKQQQPPTQPQTAQQKAGQDIIVNGVCSGCHDLGDEGPGTPTAPDLTHLMSRSTFAGGMYELNQDNLRRWLEDTQAMKPGNDMDHKFSQQQIDALMSYLLTLR